MSAMKTLGINNNYYKLYYIIDRFITYPSLASYILPTSTNPNVLCLNGGRGLREGIVLCEERRVELVSWLVCHYFFTESMLL